MADERNEGFEREVGTLYEAGVIETLNAETARQQVLGSEAGHILVPLPKNRGARAARLQQMLDKIRMEEAREALERSWAALDELREMSKKIPHNDLKIEQKYESWLGQGDEPFIQWPAGDGRNDRPMFRPSPMPNSGFSHENYIFPPTGRPWYPGQWKEWSTMRGMVGLDGDLRKSLRAQQVLREILPQMVALGVLYELTHVLIVFVEEQKEGE